LETAPKFKIGNKIRFFSFLSLQQAVEVAVVALEEAEAEAEERDGKLKLGHLVSHVLQPHFNIYQSLDIQQWHVEMIAFLRV
jgi:hypothetical protein